MTIDPKTPDYCDNAYRQAIDEKLIFQIGCNF